jgi:hypothetical protein
LGRPDRNRRSDRFLIKSLTRKVSACVAEVAEVSDDAQNHAHQLSATAQAGAGVSVARPIVGELAE